MSPWTHTITEKAIEYPQVGVVRKKKLVTATHTTHKNVSTINNRVDNIQASSDHSGQSLSMKILLDEEIEIVAAKSKILLQVDLEILILF